MYYDDNTEGFKGRTLTLYHMTSKEAASSIVRSQDMTPGSSGMFGGGIYFAETREVCSRKARRTEVLLKAEVQVGISLVCRDHDRGTNYKRLISEKGYDSVKAVGCVSSPEYVVYKSSQVRSIQYVDNNSMDKEYVVYKPTQVRSIQYADNNSMDKEYNEKVQKLIQGVRTFQADMQRWEEIMPGFKAYFNNVTMAGYGNIFPNGCNSIDYSIAVEKKISYIQ